MRENEQNKHITIGREPVSDTRLAIFIPFDFALSTNGEEIMFENDCKI